MAQHVIATVTQNHSIEVVDGHLTISGEQQTLAPEETEALLTVLLIWRFGLEEIDPPENLNE